MKISNSAAVLALGLILPAGVVSASPDDEVTIRVMEMHENTADSVMNRIELPDAAFDTITEDANYKKRKHSVEPDGDGEGAGVSIGDIDRGQGGIMDQERTIEAGYEFENGLPVEMGMETEPPMAHDMEQERIELENDRQEQVPGSETPDDNQQGSRPER